MMEMIEGFAASKFTAIPWANSADNSRNISGILPEFSGNYDHCYPLLHRLELIYN